MGRPGTFGLHQQTGFVAGIGVPAAWLVARRRAGVPEVPKSALMVRRAVARSVGIRAGAVSVQETRYVLGLLRRIQPELGPVIEELHEAGVPFPVDRAAGAPFADIGAAVLRRLCSGPASAVGDPRR